MGIPGRLDSYHFVRELHRFRRAEVLALVILTVPFVCDAQPGTIATVAGITPAITAVVDAAAYTSNIAEGSVFVVKGTNLCGSGTVYGTVPYSTGPLNGVQISFTPVGGGAASNAFMVYTYGAGSLNQLAAILPSTVPPGSYDVTVTRDGSVSAAFKVSVVAHKFGIISVNGSGAGRGGGTELHFPHAI
jgi:hypothetical protein